jgi:hypothetical protein
MPPNDLVTEPVLRNLRIFAFDPSVAAQTDTAGIGEIIISIPWETNLQPGPVGEYLEVVDADPASGVFYKPVDLNDPWVLAKNGLAPSERNPQFHQQMVYAVAMTTINHFEQALGRVALWSKHRPTRVKDDPTPLKDEFVRRLRIYPHALRDRNAFYSPKKKALLFGYFPVNKLDANNTPGTIVFTALSHDIIAHETTHALLDGVHPRFNEAVNLDVLAFHEAFADIVALFQHFSYPGVLRHQIARTRGKLAGENLLGQLAQQFGRASGRGSALRDALGSKDDKTGVWSPHQPDVRALDERHEPHARGAILVAAVFGAFVSVYNTRTADLYRIASEGTGELRPGEIHPDLGNRLAAEAQRAAQYTLQMCIRALDYCPPVGITFGDYLRAIITADQDLNPEETIYRLHFAESFRKWGIHPRGRSSSSVEGLLWPTLDEAIEERLVVGGRKSIRGLFKKKRKVGPSDGEPSMNVQPPGNVQPAGDKPLETTLSWNLETDRAEAWKATHDHAAVLWAWLVEGEGNTLADAFGLVLKPSSYLPATVFRSRNSPYAPTVEVHSVRSAIRRTPRGGSVTDLVVEITQRRRGYYDAARQREMDKSETVFAEEDRGDFIYRAGCTLLLDPIAMKVRRVIRTPGSIDDDAQLERVRRFKTEGLEPPNAFDSASTALDTAEPFAMLHKSQENL